MKKQLLLLALMLGSQISAQTVKDALHELNGSALEYFKIVDITSVPEFQERNRSKLNTLLSQDISTVTLDQMEAIKRAIDSVVNTMSSSIKNVSKEDFSYLAEDTKEELQEVIEEVIQQAELQRLANESAELQRLEEEMAQQKRLAEAALAQTIAAQTLSIGMLGTEGSTMTDPIASPLPTGLAQLTEELSSLDETSFTDVDTALLNHSDILEGFMNERMGNSTEQEYQDALGLLFKTEGIKIDDTILPGLATRLHNMQTMPHYNLEELDEESINMLLAQLTPEKIKNLAQEISGKDNPVNDWDTIINTGIDTETLSLVHRLTPEQKNLILKDLDDAIAKLNYTETVIANNESGEDKKSSIDVQRKYNFDLSSYLNRLQTKPHHIIPMTLGINPQTTQSLPSDYPADMEDVD